MTVHIFDDDVCSEEDERDFYHTQIPYQSLLLKECLADFKGSTAILLDCAFAGLGVLKGNQSLLAACGPTQAASMDALSLTSNVADVLREAAAKESWVSWGGLHANILLRSLRPGVIANRPIWQQNSHKSEKDVDFMFRPLPKKQDEGGFSTHFNVKPSYKEWNNSLPVCSVILAAQVTSWSDSLTARFEQGMTLKPLDGVDASQTPIIVGSVINVLQEEDSTSIQFRVDGRVFHELACHPAITFVSGPHKPIAALQEIEEGWEVLEK